MNGTMMIVLFSYLLLMLAIGWYSYRKITSNADFAVAGRRLGPFVIAGSLAATEIGGGSTLGVAENAMNGYGLSASWYVLTMGIAFLILALFAPVFRRTGVKTVPEYIRARYGKTCGLLTAVLMFVPAVGLTASQFIASAAILSIMLPMDYQVAVIVIAVVVTIYSIMGGFWSVALTDCFQIFLTIGGMLLTLPFALRYAGGWGAVRDSLAPELFRLSGGYRVTDILSLIIMYVATFSVGQEAASRIYAARDGSCGRKGALLASAVHLLFALIPAMLGLILLSLLSSGKIAGESAALFASGQSVAYLASGILPPFLCGLLFTGVLSATMSSSDSDLLAAGVIFANDIYRVHIRPDADETSVIRVTKLTMCAVGIVAMIMAALNTQSILNILTFCFTIRAAGVFFPYLIGLFWKRASAAGTIASVIAGTAVVYAAELFDGTLFGVFFSQPIVPGLAASLLCFVLFSLLFPRKETH